MNLGFIKLIRSQHTLEFFKHPHEYTLFSLIAYRARRTNSSKLYNLKIGEALVGDHISCGMTRQKYRIALKNLIDWGFIETKPTNKGTIATIINSDILDINIDEANHQENHQENHQTTTKTTTNKNDKNDNNGKNDKNKRQFSQKEFDLFYSLFPNKKERKAAIARWKTLCKSNELPEIEIIVAAIEKQIEWRATARGAFRPEWKNPSTWLNKGCWADEVNIIENGGQKDERWENIARKIENGDL